jgi:hypothetical protein
VVLPDFSMEADRNYRTKWLTNGCTRIRTKKRPSPVSRSVRQGDGMIMNKYWSHWKRGWWAWLMILCANLSLAFLFVPLAFIFHDMETIYWLSAMAIWLIVGAPLWGWLFEKFAAASPRIPRSQMSSDSSDVA